MNDKTEIQVRAVRASDWRDLHEKFSFVIEGTKCKYAFHEGEYVMARVKDQI